MSKETTIEKVLVLSTGHISKEADRILTDKSEAVDEINLFRYVPHHYGYILFLYQSMPSQEELAQVGLECLLPILALAHEEGCQYVNLDRDEDTIDGLETFDW